MLTSITPLGERGRGNRFWLTRGWLILGHVIGGLLLGAVLAAASAVVGAVTGRPNASVTLVVIAASTVAAVVGDLCGVTVPGRRQVDERWLTSYRGWVYGLGFGTQLGFGLVTVVNTLLLGVVLLCGFLLSPAHALLLGGVYGLTRGVGASINGWVRTVKDLRLLHQRLDQSERAVRWTSLGTVTIVAVGAALVS